MHPYCGVIFNRKSGKIIKAVDSVHGYGMIEFWILEVLTKTRDAVIFSKVTGKVVFYAEGTEGCPKVRKENLGHIDDYRPGMFEAVQVE